MRTEGHPWWYSPARAPTTRGLSAVHRRLAVAVATGSGVRSWVGAALLPVLAVDPFGRRAPAGAGQRRGGGGDHDGGPGCGVPAR
jgi:hypothetical protein